MAGLNLGAILGPVLGAAGTAVGGPVGGAVGGAAGSLIGGALSPEEELEQKKKAPQTPQETGSQPGPGEIQAVPQQAQGQVQQQPAPVVLQSPAVFQRQNQLTQEPPTSTFENQSFLSKLMKNGH